MEELLFDLGLKDGIFAIMFLWLLSSQMKASTAREEKLYSFLSEIKTQFGNLVGSYERLSRDVTEIREEITEIKHDAKGE